LRLPAGASIASVFSRLVANRIAPDTHRDQAIGDELSIALAAEPPQRNVGARRSPMGFTEPWLLLAQRQSSVAHRLGDPVICKQEAGQKVDPIRTMAFTSRDTGLAPFAPPFN
jgi:hypothetical protein